MVSEQDVKKLQEAMLVIDYRPVSEADIQSNKDILRVDVEKWVQRNHGEIIAGTAGVVVVTLNDPPTKAVLGEGEVVRYHLTNPEAKGWCDVSIEIFVRNEFIPGNDVANNLRYFTKM